MLIFVKLIFGKLSFSFTQIYLTLQVLVPHGHVTLAEQ